MTLLQDRDSRREELLGAADAVVRRDGASASMASIAAEAGITKPILYRHFGDKGGLYAALAERHTDRLLDALVMSLTAGGPPQARVRRTVDTYLTMIENEPSVYRFLVESEEAVQAREPVEGFVRRLEDLLASGIAHELGLEADSLKAWVWAAGIVGMVQAAGDRWLADPACPRAELTALLTDLIWGRYGAESEAR